MPPKKHGYGHRRNKIALRLDRFRSEPSHRQAKRRFQSFRR